MLEVTKQKFITPPEILLHFSYLYLSKKYSQFLTDLFSSKSIYKTHLALNLSDRWVSKFNQIVILINNDKYLKRP